MGGGTADAGFDQVFGALGSITVTGGCKRYPVCDYDINSAQMVLGTADGPGGCSPASDFDVVALVAMSLADYNAFGTGGSLAFI